MAKPVKPSVPPPPKNHDVGSERGEATESDRKIRRVFLCGCMDKRSHTKYIHAIACDLMPWFYVSCNPTERQKLLFPDFGDPKAHFLSCDLVLFWQNVFTSSSDEFSATLRQADAIGVPIICLQSPMSRSNSTRNSADPAGRIFRSRTSHKNRRHHLTFDPLKYAESMCRLLVKIKSVLNMSRLDMGRVRIPGNPLSDHPRPPHEGRLPSLNDSNLNDRLMRLRDGRRSSSLRARFRKNVNPECIPRFLTDECLHKPSSTSPNSTAESGYGSDKLVSTLSISDPSLYHSTRYLIFDKPRPDNSQKPPKILHFPDDLPKSSDNSENPSALDFSGPSRNSADTPIPEGRKDSEVKREILTATLIYSSDDEDLNTVKGYFYPQNETG